MTVDAATHAVEIEEHAVRRLAAARRRRRDDRRRADRLRERRIRGDRVKRLTSEDRDAAWYAALEARA